jgi:signal peptidase II
MKRKTWILWSLMIAVLILIDQSMKILYYNNRFEWANIKVIDQFFYLTYVENKGAAFGIFKESQLFLIIITLMALIIIVYMFTKFPAKRYRFAFALIAAGAVGNLIDRIYRGFVVDFFHFFPFGYDFAVFNFADIFLNVGAAFMIICVLFFPIKEKIH